MRLPRVRLTVRRMIALVALLALLLAIAREYGEDHVSLYTIRRLPGRMQKLRPGMTHEQVSRGLGLSPRQLRGSIGGGPTRYSWTHHGLRPGYSLTLEYDRTKRPPRLAGGSLHGPSGRLAVIPRPGAPPP